MVKILLYIKKYEKWENFNSVKGLPYFNIKVVKIG